MKAAIGMVAILFCFSAEAADFQDIDGSWWRLQAPPAHYFDNPAPPKKVVYLPRSEVFALCEKATMKAAQKGCAILWPGEKCEIYLAEDMPERMRDHVQIHEAAHCHSWPADHPTH